MALLLTSVVQKDAHGALLLTEGGGSGEEEDREDGLEREHCSGLSDLLCSLAKL